MYHQCKWADPEILGTAEDNCFKRQRPLAERELS